MGKTQDLKPKIMPSRTRTGTALGTHATLDSPSILSQLVTPPPPSRTNEPHSDMSHVINDASDNTIDDATTMLDDTTPLGDFLDEQIAKAKEIERLDDSPATPIAKRTPIEYDENFDGGFMACDTDNGPDALIELLKRKALGDMFLPNDDFCASPIYIKDDAYDFSIEPEVTTIVEADAFHGNENEKALEHFRKAFAKLFSNKDTNLQYYMKKERLIRSWTKNSIRQHEKGKVDWIMHHFFVTNHMPKRV